MASADRVLHPTPGGITCARSPAFWAGITAVTAGVLLHLPMYLGARDMGYRLDGTDIDLPMTVGMVLILVGLAATTYGLFPRPADSTAGHVSRIRVKALDDAPIRPAHIGLLLVMAAAVTIDVMKPTTLGFVLPGMTKEYGLKSALNPAGSPPAALLPLFGITGTVIGSFVWGWLGDRIGRRASILLAGVLFVATAVCGSMPSFSLNLAMCFVMGLGVGGMLPITFALMSETIPARHRGWVMVLIGGDVAGAYILTSWLSTTLVPEYGWRVLWLLGLPTGLALLLLNHWIPESPRFLLARGREDEARVVMGRYGAVVVHDESPELAVEAGVKGRYAQLLQPPFMGLSAVVVLLGLGVGLVTFGFQLWIPSNLQRLGYNEVTANRILRDSALIGFPLNFGVAWLYGAWSSKRTIALLCALTAAALIGFVVAGDEVANDRGLLQTLLVVPTWGISSMVAVLFAYSSEVFPTSIRSRGTGLAAAASKAGGVAIIALVAAAVTPPSIAWTAAMGAVPVVLALVAVGMFGVETRQRRLEEITAEELRVEPAVVR
ncbi:MAG TPA: MFS transporter [Acidimicrobiales bacterium]|nr:MFS transporter [Acidimicrobiales bacterium]